jgi:mono/diheme cytochrome c family protein
MPLKHAAFVMPPRRLGALALLALAPSFAAGTEPPSAAPAAALTYSRDIAPIFRKRCESCHRPGEAAPMALLDYEGIRPWLKSIKKEVAARRMPPWHADPRHGKFANDPTLTQDEIDAVVRWVDAGGEEGDRTHLPPANDWVEGWRIGKPDATFEIPEPYTVKASGTVPYKYFLVPTGFKEDRWVVRADVRPGNRAVVHHIIVFAIEPGGSLGQNPGAMFRKEISGFAPGEGPSIFPAGTGKRIKAGSSLLFQVHYTPDGTEQTDRSKVGFVFAREPIKEEIVTQAVLNWRFRIPPGAADHVVEARPFEFRGDAVLYSLMPHMHLRGKSFEFRLITPDGKEEVLLSVPKWDFDWQHFYRLAEPRPIARGSRIRCVASYDNSKANKSNPDAEKTVRWGDQTWEEMMIGFLSIGRKVDAAAEPSTDGEDEDDDEAGGG